MIRSTPALAGLLAALLSAAACGGAPSAPARPSGPPSIVLVSLDTTRADHLGCYGDASAATPTIDAEASRGVAFDRAYTTVPATLPAHASLMTGLDPTRHGVRDNGIYRLPDDVPTLAERLRARGYATRAVIASAVLDRQYGLDRGFERYDDATGMLAGLEIPERPAAAVADAALAALAGVRRPYFLFVHFFDPHADYRPPPPFDARFRDRPYDGEIAYVDAELGRLLDALRARGQIDDDTVVAIVADHGESLGEHGEPTHGVFLYQATVRIPMILVAPGRVAPGGRSDRLASIVDVAPTLLEIAGAAPLDGIDGRSLLRAKLDGDRVALLETEFGYDAYGWAPLYGATDGTWKWIDAPRPELYDLASDPSESSNRLPQRSDEADRLRAARSRAVVDDRVAPPPGGEAPAGAAAEQARKLAGLGYVAATARPRPSARGLPDPKDVVGTLAVINDARAAISAGRPGDAARMLEPVVARSPGNLSALVLLGSARLGAGDPKGAVEPLRRAAELSPEKSDVHYNLGLALMQSGDAEGAERAWRRTLEVAPRSLEAAANLADLLDRTGRAAEAEEVVRDAREHGLDAPILDYLDGRLALERGDRAGALRLLDRALAGRLPPSISEDARMLRFRAAN